MTRCENVRWHPFKAGDDMPKNCVKPAGHDGTCRDYRGDYEGSPGRAREMTPEEVDTHNLSDAEEGEEGAREVECASPRCILPSGHTGVHTDHPAPFVMNAAVSQLAGLLATPGLPRDAADTLAKAATVFTTVDSLIRTGSPLPSRWASPRVGGLFAGIDTTPIYESLWEALSPEPPGSGYSVSALPTLRSACRWWRSLDVVLRAGGALPASWAEVSEGV